MASRREDDREGTSLDDDLLPTCFAAAIENRAKEVGVALLDLAALRLELYQFVEPGHLYTSTLLHLVPRAPQQVVVVASNHHEVRRSDTTCMHASWPSHTTSSSISLLPLPMLACH